MKKLLIGLFIVVIALGIGVAWYNRQPQATNGPSHGDFIYAITDRFPLFLDDNNPVIEVADMKRVEVAWYIVTIKSIHEDEASVPVKALFTTNDSSGQGSRPNLMLGPDTHFTEPELLEYNVPDSVIIELQKS